MLFFGENYVSSTYRVNKKMFLVPIELIIDGWPVSWTWFSDDTVVDIPSSLSIDQIGIH